MNKLMDDVSITITNIEWDDDGEEVNLPKKVTLKNVTPEDEIADILSDEYGYCVKSFSISQMTREEAKDWIENLISEMKKETSGNYPDPEYCDEVYDALEIALEALKINPCEDAVSREAVIALAKEECETAVIPYKRFIKGVNALPPVIPKQRTGNIEELKKAGIL